MALKRPGELAMFYADAQHQSILQLNVVYCMPGSRGPCRCELEENASLFIKCWKQWRFFFSRCECLSIQSNPIPHVLWPSSATTELADNSLTRTYPTISLPGEVVFDAVDYWGGQGGIFFRKLGYPASQSGIPCTTVGTVSTRYHYRKQSVRYQLQINGQGILNGRSPKPETLCGHDGIYHFLVTVRLNRCFCFVVWDLNYRTRFDTRDILIYSQSLLKNQYSVSVCIIHAEKYIVSRSKLQRVERRFFRIIE